MAIYESILDAALSNVAMQINRLNNDELKELLENDEKIESMVKDLQQVKSLVTEKEMLLAQNKSLAEWNLSQEPKIREGKERLLETFEQASKLKGEAEQLKSRLDAASNQRSIDTTHALLQTAAAQSEEESEKIAETFLSGEMNAEQFLTEFKPKRYLAHMRKIKAEKLYEIMRMANRSSVAAASQPQSSSSWNYRT